jgi:hypothetical protein
MNSHHLDLETKSAVQHRFPLDSTHFRTLLSRKRRTESDVVRILTQPSRPWESLKRFILLFVCSLAFGLACSELPELLTPNDDTSNDFIECASAPGIERPQTAGLQAAPRSCTFPPRVPSSIVLNMDCLQPALPSGTDLLRLLTFQRK